MAKILYRQTLAPTEPGAVSAGSAVKGTPLTLAEGDYNYKALNDDIAARAALQGAAFTGAVSGTSLQMSGSISGSSLLLQTALPITSGGSGSTTQQGARANFGATTLGSNLFTVTNPSAVSFIRINADNTVSTLDATTFRTAIGAGTSQTTGTVTQVSGTGSVSGLSLAGTVTSSGNLTLSGTLAVAPSNFSSQSANSVLIAPTGAAGVPTFRTLVAADIPILNQNTTGTAQNVTGVIAIANGGTGATTASGALNSLGARGITESTSLISINTTAVAQTVYVLTASLTLTLPVTPTAGQWVSVVNRSGTTTAIVARNGSNIMGLAEDFTVDIENLSVTFMFADATRGWVMI